MVAKVTDYFTPEEWAEVQSFAETADTPCQIILKDVIRRNYELMRKHLPYASVYYAVKANPHPEILRMLFEAGSNFDVASVYELRALQKLGVPAERMSCGNTIKKEEHVREFYQAGVRLFVTDSEADLRNIAEAAPGSKVFVRLMTEGVLTADWPLSRKFGCQADLIFDLVLLAKELGLDPCGISFHVGSQQRDIAAWHTAIAKVKYVFDQLDAKGIRLRAINLGGGFPAHYIQETNSVETYCKEITRFLSEDFGDRRPDILIEPGRSLAGNAGVLVTEVVLISRKSRTALARWVYTDAGIFNGMTECLNESIKYPLYTTRTGAMEKVILAGPTCDSLDILYENNMYELPLDLAIGDRLYWLSTGAYTSSYSTVGFCGFPPLRTVVL